MKQIVRFLFITVVLASTSCKTTRNAQSARDDGKIELVFVQVNDVYEIAALSGGKEGGMARVATFRWQRK